MQSNQNTLELLTEYEKVNERRRIEASRRLGIPSDQGSQQTLTTPSPHPVSSVPTLVKGVYQSITPMIKARFEYASTWTEADGGIAWLSIQEMEEAAMDNETLRMVNDRIEIWNETPLKGVPFSRISLFGLYRVQGEEMYLLWPETSGQEPAIISYSGNYETEFSDFDSYLRSQINGE